MSLSIEQQEIERLREHIRQSANYLQVSEHAFIAMHAELVAARLEIERLQRATAPEHTNAGNTSRHP